MYTHIIIYKLLYKINVVYITMIRNLFIQLSMHSLAERERDRKREYIFCPLESMSVM